MDRPAWIRVLAEHYAGMYDRMTMPRGGPLAALTYDREGAQPLMNPATRCNGRQAALVELAWTHARRGASTPAVSMWSHHCGMAVLQPCFRVYWSDFLRPSGRFGLTGQGFVRACIRRTQPTAQIPDTPIT